ncbi:MAG: hypothetical protein WC915_05380 [archaeon]|jgi:hypothetical protein
MKNIIILTIAVTLVLVFFGCTETKNITNFEECVAAGFPVMESYPRQCSDGINTFTENIEKFCSQEEMNAEACIEIYDPVCANVQIECITTPCDPIKETFSNSCFACMNDRVFSYEKGECN